MLIKCSTCGKRIPKGWLFRGLPWSKYTCAQCGSVFSGTILRTLLISIASGLLCYILIGALKGKINPVLLIPALAGTLILLFFDLPKQIKRIDQEVRSKDAERQ